MISITMGTLNREKYLRRMVNNTALSCDKLELVIVDGGSTDNTVGYLKSLNHPRIKLIEYGRKSPAPHFTNLAIKNSSHEYVCIWNDDVVLLNKWEYVIDKLKDESIDVLNFGWIRRTDEGNKMTEEELLSKLDEHHHLDNPVSSLNLKKVLALDSCINYGVINKRVLRKVGMYLNLFNFYNCDWDLGERIIRFGYRFVVDKSIVVASFEPPKQNTALFDDGTQELVPAMIRDYYSKGLLHPNTELLN